MHHDFFRMKDAVSGLPEVISVRLCWSEYAWGIRFGDWLAVYRSLDLSLIFINLNVIKNSSWVSSEAEDRLNEELESLGMTGNHHDKEELDRLKNCASSGGFRFICVLPTSKCSLKCAYCHQKSRSAGKDTTSDDLQRGLKRCAELISTDNEFIDLLIYGGEPLNAFGIVTELLETVKKKGLFAKPVRISLTTSGWGMTGARAQYLSENNVFTIISLDGSPKTNDNVRKTCNGTSSFLIAERAFEMLKSRGSRVGLSVTIGKHNADSFEEELKYLLDRMKPNDIGLNAFLHPVEDIPNLYQVESKQAFDTLLRGIELTKVYGIYAEQPMRRLRPFVFRRPLLKDCSSPGERLVLAPGGLMGFCDSFFPSKEHFYDIDDFPSHNSQEYRRWQKLSSVEMPACSRCPAMTVCGGACRFDAFKASGKLDGVDSLRCEFELSFLSKIIWNLFRECGQMHSQPYFIPKDSDRRKLMGAIDLSINNQPFIAGSYSQAGAKDENR